jgi:hypothetical protein
MTFDSGLGFAITAPSLDPDIHCNVAVHPDWTVEIIASVPIERPPVVEPHVVRPQRLYNSAGEAKNEASRHIEQLAGRPSHIGCIVPPGVEKQAAVIEGEAPLGF